jgi:beta-lactamase class A
MTTLTSLTRRGLLAGVVLGLLPSVTGCSERASGPDRGTGQQAVTSSLAGLEHRFDARLGAYARDTGTGAELGYRADDRFPMCSTYKVLAAAAVLNRSFSGTNERLCEAAVRYSDNAAANSLLEELGGPAGVTAYARSLGDHVTRLDRTEPTLNQALPGDLRDTTSPRAIATDYDAIVLGTAISPADRALITGWLKDSKTGADRIRASVPVGWTVADKTGTGGYGTDNDVAILWPPQRSPITLAIMSTHSTAAATPDNTLVATTARMVLAALGVLRMS